MALVALGREDRALGYGSLHRRIRGISRKMLTDTLRALERDGLVTREVVPTVPVRVDYGLSAVGRGLVEVLTQMDRWAAENVPEMERLRDRFDESERESPRPSVLELNAAPHRIRVERADRVGTENCLLTHDVSAT